MCRKEAEEKAVDILVSVIMPTFNRGDFIERAIESVLAQTYKNIELLIVDDNGSGTDAQVSTERKIQKYVDGKKVRYMKNKKNMGGSLARNNGILHSNGTYVTFLDDDDMYWPEKIEIQLRAMETEHLDISIVDDEVRNGKGKFIKRTARKLNQFPAKEELLKEHLMNHITGTNDMMFRRDYLDRLDGFEQIEAGQEYILMLKAIMEGGKFGYIPQVLVTFYEHDFGRISTSIKKIEAQKKLMEIKKTYFSYLSRSEQNYILCRNHVVCAYIYMKNHQYGNMSLHMAKAFRISPTDFIHFIKR